MEYLEKNYNYLRNLGETQTKKKAYETKNQKIDWFGLVYYVLWHINLCRLFNAKSIFM